MFAGFLSQKFGSVQPVPHADSVLDPEAQIPVRQKLLILIDIHRGDPGRGGSGSGPDLDIGSRIRQTREFSIGMSSQSIPGVRGVPEFLLKLRSG